MDQSTVLASAYNGRGEGSRLAKEDRDGTAAAATPFDHHHAAALVGLRSEE